MTLIENKSQFDDQISRAIAIASSELLVKARLGAITQAFDPNAIDGDGDGFVQDGTPFMRPAIISAIANASQRLGNILSKVSKQSKQGRAGEYQRRYSGMSAKEIAKDAVPDSLEGLLAKSYEQLRVSNPDLPPFSADATPDQVRDMASALEKYIENDLRWMLSADDAKEFDRLLVNDRNAAFRKLLDGAFDFDPKKVAKQRRLLEHVLTTNPQFREMVERFGIPTIFSIGPAMDEAHIASAFYSDETGIGLGNFGNPKGKGRIAGLSRGFAKWFMTGVLKPEVGSTKTKRWVANDSPESLLMHEYGHYLSTVIGSRLSDLDTSERTKKYQAWRFAIGSSWKDTFDQLGHPEWFDRYKRTDEKAQKDIPDEIPHIETGYGESVPAEAWAESIAAVFGLGGRDSDLVSQGMKDLIADALGLDPTKDLRDQLTPPRIARVVAPEGFASLGAVNKINNERDSRYGELTDPYDLVGALIGDLGKNDEVGQMVRELQKNKDNPKSAYHTNPDLKWAIDTALNIRVANEEQATVLAQTILDNPAFADMIRRHGIPQIYFSETDMMSRTGVPYRGAFSGGFVPDDSIEGTFWKPRIVLDSKIDEYSNIPDTPTKPSSLAERAEYKAQKVFGNVTRTHVSSANTAIIRHESGHAVHDALWERQHRGEITGRRAQLLRAYEKKTWEEFYTELGRPDLWAEHQRALKASNTVGYPGDPNPSDEIQQIDSSYAYAAPREFFAEVFTAYTSSDPEQRALINDTALDHMQSMVGDANHADLPEPPAMDTGSERDIPEPPALDGFASGGERTLSSYEDIQKGMRDDPVQKKKFRRSELFENATTDEVVQLAVPTSEREFKLMAWDAVFEQMGLTIEQVNLIDLTDPDNPTVPNKYAIMQDRLDFHVNLIKSMGADFDPKLVRTNQEALRESLDAYPRLRDAVRRNGMPPVVTPSEQFIEAQLQRYTLGRALESIQSGKDIDQALRDVINDYIDFEDSRNIAFVDWVNDPKRAAFRDYFDSSAQRDSDGRLVSPFNGGYYAATQTMFISPGQNRRFADGSRVDRAHIPIEGDHLIGAGNFETTVLHEYGHYLDYKLKARADAGDPAAIALMREKMQQFRNAQKHIGTRYATTDVSEYAAELFTAIATGSRDAEELLSPAARDLARKMAGFPTKMPVFTGTTRIKKDSPSIVDRFGKIWRRLTNGSYETLGGESRSRDGVPDVLELMVDAKRRNIKPLEPVQFVHNGRDFSINDAGDTIEIDINGRTVATGSIVEGMDGLPEIRSVEVSPGYEGITPDKDLHEMIVDHARKKYPSARAPKQARKSDAIRDGFASVGDRNTDLTGLEGTPGTPEYAESAASAMQAAQDEGKKIMFNYNGELRTVEVTKVVKEMAGDKEVWYMYGKDELRNGEERQFRLDRVSMPKVVKNPETKKKEVPAFSKKSRPREPVPVFTGKAAELFEGAESWEEVAQRLSKGEFVFFDFETTGIEADIDSNEMLHPGTPTQIGLVRIVDGVVVERWSTYVNPGRPMSIDPETGRSWSADNLKYTDEATGEVKNLTDEWLSGQMPLNEALEEMLKFIGPDTILGGQNSPYDDSVMKRAMADAGIDSSRWSPAGFIDSQALAQSLLDKKSDDYPRDPVKGYKTVSLKPLAAFLGYDMGDKWHSADADAEASYEAFSRLLLRAATQENSGIAVRRDLFSPGSGETEYQERMADFNKQMRGFNYRLKQHLKARKVAQEAETATVPSESDGFASGGSRVGSFINRFRKARVPDSWSRLTQQERDELSAASAKNATELLNELLQSGEIDLDTLKNLDPDDLDGALLELFQNGTVRVKGLTGEGFPLVETTSATEAKVLLSLGLHVEVISDDPNQKYILENGIDDMQKALQDYVATVAKDPAKLAKDKVFRDWASKQQPPFDVDGATPEQLKKKAKKFAETFEINMCLYYTKGENMLCGANIGIQREQMPQLGGRLKGDDTVAAQAIRAGLLVAKEFALDKEKLGKLDEAKQKELTALANDPAKVAELAKSNNPLAKELFDVLNWNDTEANAESIADQAAGALGIAVDTPRFVDPATMLGAQNQLQGSKVENMANGATSTFLETILNLNNQAIPILDDSAMTDEWIMNKFGVDKDGVPKIRTKIAELRTIAADPARYKELAEKSDKRLMDMAKIIDLQAAADLITANPAMATPEKVDEYLDYLANVRRHGLFQPTLTAGTPGSAIYMLDGHHRWSGLLMANRKLEEMGLDVRVQLNIKNYQTDIRTGLELGRAVQVAMGIKDAKLSGEDMFVADEKIPALTREAFDEIIKKIVDPASMKEALKKIREGQAFRKTEDADANQAGRLGVKPYTRPLPDAIQDAAFDGSVEPPKSRVEGIKAQSSGYRAAATGKGWQSVEDHISIETERGNKLFDTYKEYSNAGYEASYVTHNPKEAGRYAVDAGEVDAWRRGEVRIDPASIDKVDLTGATLVGSDDEGGFLYVRKRQTPSMRRRSERIKNEEKYLDGFGFGTSAPLQPEQDFIPGTSIPMYEEDDGFASSGGAQDGLNITSSVRGGKEQKSKPVVNDDFYTRRATTIAGIRVPNREVDEFGTPLPGNPIFRQEIKLNGKKYTFEVNAEGIVTVYTGRKYEQVGQMTLDRGHSAIGGRKEDRDRHHIQGITVVKKHRRKGIATEMARVAEHAYGGQIEHSKTLSAAGKAWRDADVQSRGTPADTPTFADPFDDDSGFASRGASNQDVGQRFLENRLSNYESNSNDTSTAEINMLAIYQSWKDNDGTWDEFTERFPEFRGTVDEAIKKFDVAGRTPGMPAETEQAKLLREAIEEAVRNLGPVPQIRPTGKPIRKPDRAPLMGIPMPGEADPYSTGSWLGKISDRLELDELPNGNDRGMSAITGRMFANPTTEATLAEKLDITPQQLRDQLNVMAGNVNEFVDRFINDKEVRRKVKLGYKLIGVASMLFGAKGMKDFMSTLNPNLSGGDGSSASDGSLLDLVDTLLSSGIHEALIAYGSNFANLIATEYSSMRLVAAKRAKEMVAEIQSRIEGAGQKIGVISDEMWNRLRGSWAKTRALAPVGTPSMTKQWLVTGSSAMWAELSWLDYQSKTRPTRDLLPTNIEQWGALALKVGNSPELIDIATYRAGMGYGDKRIKSRDVVRVFI